MTLDALGVRACSAFSRVSSSERSTIREMLGQGAQGLLGGPPADGDLVKGALAHLPQLLLLHEHTGPLASAGVDRGQIEPEGIDHLRRPGP